MHQIYEDHGSFNFIFQISTIIYSTIITLVINTILKFLALTSDNISDFKKGISKQNIDKKNKSLKKKIKIKFILYFIISTISHVKIKRLHFLIYKLIKIINF